MTMNINPLDMPADRVESLLYEYKYKWREITLSTTSADDAAPLGDILRDIYAIWALPPPHTIVWCGSPAAAKIAVVASELLRVRIKRECPDGHMEWDALWEPINKHILSKFAHVLKIAPTLPSSVEGSIRRAFYDERIETIHQAVLASFDITNLPSTPLGMATTSGLYMGTWHSHEFFRNAFFQTCLQRFRDEREHWQILPLNMSWVSRHSLKATEWLFGGNFSPLRWSGCDMGDILPAVDFYREIFGMKKETAQIEPFIRLAQHTRWAWKQPGVAFIAEPPEIFRVTPREYEDSGFRLHCKDGPALRFRDGVELHAFVGFVDDPRQKQGGICQSFLTTLRKLLKKRR